MKLFPLIKSPWPSAPRPAPQQAEERAVKEPADRAFSPNDCAIWNDIRRALEGSIK
jgi:hypothetical protein